MAKTKKPGFPLGYDPAKTFYCDDCKKGVKLVDGRCEKCKKLIYNCFSPLVRPTAS
jgi:hypothetical protein